MSARGWLVSLLLGCLAWAACGDDPVAGVAPSIRVIPTHQTDDGEDLLDYGPVPVLNQRTLALSIGNDGRAPLLLEGIEFEGPAGVFSAGATRKEPISSGETIEFPILFVPPEEAHFQGAVTLFHNDEKKPPIRILLDGVGSTVGRVEVEPTVLDFGRVGERSQALRSFRIRSTGTAPLLIESIEMVEGAPDFSLLGSTQTPATLPPPEGGFAGGEVEVTVAFAPTEASEVQREGSVLLRTTDPDRRDIEVRLVGSVNRAPVATIEPTTGVPAPGDPIALDGSNSNDLDGDEPLTFLWRVVHKPLGSQAYIDDPSSPTPQLVTDVAGAYRIGLDVADATGLSCLHPDDNPQVPCASMDLLIRTADGLVIELSWDHVTDLDLHLIEEGHGLLSAKDCYYRNPNPDFGVFGDSADDPRLVRDALKGPGPERIVFSSPPDGSFDVTVVFAKTNGAPQATTEATVKVFVYGILAAEMSRVLERPDERWDALSIRWPSATISAIDEITAPK